MDIRRTPLQRRVNRRIHQPNDWRNIVIASQLFNRDILVRALIAENIERQPFRGFIQHPLRLLRLLQQFGNLRHRRHARNQPRPQQAGDLVQHHQLRRIRNRNRQPVPRLLQRNEVVPEHHLDRNGLEQFVLDLEVLQIHKLGVVSPSQHLRALSLA